MIQKKTQIVTCFHCHNKERHTIIFYTKGISEFIELDPGNDIEVSTYFFLAKCQTCSNISLYTDWDESYDLGNLEEATLLYPNNKKYSESVPTAIIENYTEAKRVSSISPTAFAVLIRRCLEYICKDQKAVGNTLVEQLKDLSKKEVIPPTLSKMSDALRFFGNIGAHANKTKIDHSDASIMDDFFTTILEYVYVAPYKLNKVEKVLEEKKNIVKR